MIRVRCWWMCFRLKWSSWDIVPLASQATTWAVGNNRQKLEHSQPMELTASKMFWFNAHNKTLSLVACARWDPEEFTSHNSDLRDFHKYIHKQVWGAQIFTRQSSRRFGLVRTWLTEACSIVFYDSAHPTYLETICVLSYVAQIWVV